MTRVPACCRASRTSARPSSSTTAFAAAIITCSFEAPPVNISRKQVAAMGDPLIVDVEVDIAVVVTTPELLVEDEAAEDEPVAGE